MKVKLLFLVVLTLSCLLPALQGAPHTGTLTVLADNDKSGYVANRNVNFTEAWTATNGTEFKVANDYESALVGLNKWSGKYIVVRHFYTFDTKEIKRNYRVTSAFLVVKGATQFFSNWTVKIQRWTDTDDSLGLDDYTAFDNFFYDDGSMQEGDWVSNEYNKIPIRDDTLIVEKGYTKICLRISDEVEGTQGESAIGIQVKGVDYPVKLEVNYVWATGRVRPRGINPLFIVVAGTMFTGGISLIVLKRKELRRLYT